MVCYRCLHGSVIERTRPCFQDQATAIVALSCAFVSSHILKTAVADEVAAAIVRCQNTYTEEQRFGMSCAEPFAIHQWLVNNQQIPIVGQGNISTYGRITREDGPPLGIKDPRSITNDGLCGCQIFLGKLQIAKVGKEEDQPDLPSIEPA